MMKRWSRYLAKRQEQRAKRASEALPTRRKILFEALESRYLLSAELGVPPQDPSQDPALAVPPLTANVDPAAAAAPAAASAQTDAQAQPAGKQLIIVDPAVTDYQSLVQKITGADKNGQFDVKVLDAKTDGVEQITKILAGYQDLGAVHILSHGAQGEVQLGDTHLNGADANQYGADLSTWGQSLKPGGDLLLYGCNVADGQAGVDFVQQLAAKTGLDVAASTDATGSADFGGNWALEYKTGAIEAATLAPTDYQDLLANIIPTVSAHQLDFTGTAATDALFLGLSSGGAVQYSGDGTNFTDVGAPFVLDNNAVINVSLAGGNDSLSISAALDAALKAAQATLNFFGGDGAADKLIGPLADAAWSITGNDAGTLDSNIHFSGVEDLVGAAGNTDTFSFASGATLTGVLNGGGGTDKLIYQGTAADDQVHFVDAGVDQTRIQSDNASFQSLTFDNTGFDSVEVDTGAGHDVLSVDGLDASFTAAIGVSADDQISLGDIQAPHGLTVSAGSGITAGPAISDQQQVAHSDWTANASYSGLVQSSTTGSGTGMTVNMSVDANGLPVATLTNFGTGYSVGDLVTFSAPDSIGTPVSVEVTSLPVLQQTTVPTTFHRWTASQTYTGLTQSATTGTGTGMTADITVDAYGHPHATVTGNGTGYGVGDVVSFNAPDGVGNAVNIQVRPVLTQETAPAGFKTWTAGKTYTTVMQSTSSGAGTGMSAYITVDASGNPTIQLGQDLGSGYAIGDTVSFNAPDGVGDPVTATITGTSTKQILNINWLPNQTYANLAPVSGGSGTGLTANITTDENGLPSLSLNNPGAGYVLGETLTFSPPGNGGDPISAVIASTGSVKQLPGAKWTAGQTFKNVAAASTSGGGTGMIVNISVDADGNPVAHVVQAGTGYQDGDTIVFAAPDSTGDPLSVRYDGPQGAGLQAPVISTRMIAPGGDPLSAASVGDSGALVLNAPNITIGEGTQLLANADSGFQDGDVRITAQAALDYTFDFAHLSPFKTHDASADIEISGATIKGHNVSVFADTTTTSFSGYDVFGDGLLGYIAGHNVGNMSNASTTELTFSNRTATAPATITRSAGNWLTDNFDIGQEIKVIGSQYNDGTTYTIEDITPDTITLSAKDFLTSEVTNGTATVKQLITDTLPQDIPVQAVDENGNAISPSSIPPGTVFRASDILTGIGQQASLFTLFPVFNGVVSHATTTINIVGNTEITASGDVDIEATADSSAKVVTPSLVVGAAYADSEGRATTTLGDGVHIDAAGDVTLKSAVTNAMKSEVKISAGLVMPLATTAVAAKDPAKATGLKIPGPAISVAYGKAISDSATTIAHGATVQGHHVTVQSQNTNEFEVLTKSTVFAPGIFNPKTKEGTGKNQGSGVAVSVSDTQSHAASQVDGRIIAEGSVVVDSKSLNETNLTFAETVVRNKGIWESDANAMSSSLKDSFELSTSSIRQQTGKFGIGAGVSVATSVNHAESHIGAQGSVDTHGDLSVTATAEDVFRSAAIGAGLSQSEVAIGGAVSVAHETNEAFASIDSTVGVNVAGRLLVNSDATIPFLSPTLAASDLIDVRGLANTLSAHADALSQWLWDQFSAADQEILQNSNSTDVELRETLLSDLNRIISQGQNVYDPTRFQGVTLQKSTTDQLNLNLTGEWLTRRNRLVLADAYAGLIAYVEHGPVPVEQYNKIIEFFTNETKSGSPLFVLGDILDPHGLATKIAAQADPLSQWLWGQFSAQDQTSLQTMLADTMSTDAQFEDLLRSEFNTIISKGTSIYDTARFAGVTLSQATQDLKNSNPTGADLTRLNHLLLADGYSAEISHTEHSVVPSLDGVGLNANTLQTVDDYLTRFQLAMGTLGDMGVYLDPTLGAPETLTTTYVGAASEAGDADPNTETPGRLAVSGAVNLLAMHNTAKAWIAEGAKINLDNLYALPPRDFIAGDVADAQTLSQQLTQHTDALSQWIWGQMSQADQDALNQFYNSYGTATPPTDAQVQDAMARMAGAFNAVADQGSSIYDAARFAGVSLSDLSQSLINTGLTGTDLTALNRQLLLDAYGVSLKMPSQQVVVESAAAMNVINAGGFTAIPTIIPLVGTQHSRGGAAGGTLVYLDLNNTSNAYVADGAVVHSAGDVEVASHTDAWVVNVTSQGGEGHSWGVEGGIALTQLHNQSLAYIEDTATVVSGGEVGVSAEYSEFGVTATVAVGTGAKAGVGVSVAWNKFTNDTEAFIGNHVTSGTVYPAGSVVAAGEVVVDAASYEQLFAITVAGAQAKGGSHDAPSGGGEDTSSDALDGVSLPNLFGEAPAENTKGHGGIAVSGAATVNDLHDDVTKAFISDGVTVTTGGALDVHALNKLLLIAGSGVLSYSAGDKGGSALAGGFVWNDMHRETNGPGREVLAYTDNATLHAADVDVQAHNSVDIWTFAVGGAIAGTSGKVGLVGSVNVNELDFDTRAYLGDHTVLASTPTITPEKVVIHAESNLQMVSAAGGVAVSGQAGIGAAADVGVIHNTVYANIGADADIDAENGINITASGDEHIISVGASLAVGTKKLGVSGAGASQTITTDIEAFIGANATVKTHGSILLASHDELNEIMVGGGLAYGKNLGIGVALANSNVHRIVKAYIGASADVTALGHGAAVTDPTGTVTGNGLVMYASAHDDLKLFSGGGSLSSKAALAGSAVVVTMDSHVEAYIDASALVNQDNTGAAAEQSVIVRAHHSSDILSVAGGFAGGGKLGLGAGAVVDTLDRTIKAYVGTGATVNAANNVVVEATTYEHLLLIAAGFGGSAKVGIAGSAVVVTQTDITQAQIGDNATVNADGNVVVAADSDAKILTVAGSVAFGGTAGFGVSNSTIVRTDRVESNIGKKAQVKGRGLRGSYAVPTETKGTTKDIYGVSVTATSNEDITTAAAGGAGAGEVAVAGSATVNVLHETTKAWIDQGASINADNAGAGSNQSVNVLASDNTKLLDIAGGVSGAGTVGAGAGADVVILTKDTEGYIADSTATDTTSVNAKRDVLVQALSHEKLTSFSIAGAFSGNVAIAGAAGVYVMHNTTTAHIGSNAAGATGPVVKSDGNVYVSAHDQTELDLIAGSISGSGEVSVGASAGINVFTKTTEAYIGKNADVTALANGPALLVDTGSFDISYVANSTGNDITTATDGQIAAPAGTSSEVHAQQPTADDGSTPLSNGDLNNSGLDARGLTQQRVASEHQRAVSGVAVSATSKDDIATIAINGGAAGTVAVSLGGSVNVITNHTKAYVDDGAKVNHDNTGAASGQEVFVAAGSDFYHLGVAGSIALSGAGAGAGSADVTVLHGDTQAYIGNGASVTATGDVSAVAHAKEEILSISGGISVSGSVSLSGAASPLIMHNDTYAFIGDNATVDAGGNVHVKASDDTQTIVIAGSAALGLGAAGVGGAVGVTSITKDTQAYIGQSATVDAKGNAGDLMTVYSGALDPTTGKYLDGNGNYLTKNIVGVSVEAASSEQMFTVVASGAGGFYGGLSGAVSVENINSDTQARIKDKAKINTDNTGANAGQTVNVAAVNKAKSFVVDGSLAGGLLAGISGGVDVGMIHNDTIAAIGSQVKVNALKDVDVNALAKKDVTTYVVSAGGGAVGLSGGVAVYGIGGDLQQSYSVTKSDGSTTSSSPLNAQDSGNSASTGSYVDDQLQGQSSSFADMLNQYAATTPASTDGSGNNALTDASGSLGGNSVGSDFNTVHTVPSGTSATIGGNSTITVGQDVDLHASDTLTLLMVTGSGAVGFVGIGGSVGIANIDQNTSATIGGGTTIDAGHNVSLDSSFDENLTGKAYGGGAGIASLGAQVVIINDHSDQLANLDDGAQIVRANNVSINAESDRVITIDAGGVNIGGGAVGVSVGIGTIDGTTRALVGDGALIGQQAGKTVGGLSLSAAADNSITTHVWGVAAGVVAGTGNYSKAEITDAHADQASVEAAIGANAKVKVTYDASVTASSKANAEAKAFGVSVGVGAVGVSLAHATITPTINATIAAGAFVSAGRDIKLKSAHNYDLNGNKLDKKANVNANASGGGGFAGNGVDATATSSAKLNTSVAHGASLHAGGAIAMTSLANNDADVTGNGITIGLAGVGVILGNATAGGTITTHMDGTVTGAQSLTLQATTDNLADTYTNASGGGIVSGQGAHSTSTVKPTIDTGIGNNVSGASVTVSGNVKVTSQSTTYAHSVTDGVSAGLVGIGATLATTTDSPTLKTSIGAHSTVTSTGGGVELASAHNYSLAGTRDNTSVGAVSKATVAGGGILSGQGANADATANANVDTFVGTGATLNAHGGIAATSRSYNKTDAQADGASGGLAAAAVVLSGANSSGTTTARIGDATTGGINTLTAGAGLTVKSTGWDYAYSKSTASSGGVLAGNGAAPKAWSTPTVNAYVISTGLMDVTGATTILGTALGDVTAIATGDSYGLAAGGASISRAEWSPTVNAYIGGGSRLTSTGGINIQAYNNYSEAGVIDATRLAKATASSSAGGFISGGHVQSDVVVNAKVHASIGGGADVTAANSTLNIVSKSRNNTYIDSNAHAYGLAAGGKTLGTATMNNSSLATTGNGTSSKKTKLTAGTLNVSSESNNKSDVHVTSGAGGALAISGAQGKALLNSNDTHSVIGDWNDVTVDGDATIKAYNAADMRAETRQDDSGGLISLVDVQANAKNTSSTQAWIGAHSNVYANQVFLDARDGSVYAKAKTYSKTYQAAGTTHATSVVDMNATTLAHVGAGTAITASGKISIVSFQENVHSLAQADSAIGAGLTGSLTSTATNNSDANSNISTDSGSTLTTKDLFVQAKTLSDQNSYQTLANTDAQTVVRYIWDVVDYACHTVFKILTFGLWDGHEVCDPIMGWVRQLTNSDTHAINNGHNNRHSHIGFNSDVIISGPPNPYLEVNASGDVVRADNVTINDIDNAHQGLGHVDRSTIIVNDILNNSTGKVVFDSPTGLIEGVASFKFKDAYDRVDIINHSNKDIQINRIEVWNKNKTDPDMNIGVGDQHLFVWKQDPAAATPTYGYYTLDSGVGGTIVNINTINTSDIYLNGVIDNPGGTTYVTNTGGDIWNTGTGQVLTRSLTVRTDTGNVGTSATPLYVELHQGDGQQSNFTLHSAGDLYMDIKGVLNDSNAFISQGFEVSAGGTGLVNFVDGAKQTFVATNADVTVSATAGTKIVDLDAAAATGTTYSFSTGHQFSPSGAVDGFDPAGVTTLVDGFDPASSALSTGTFDPTAGGVVDAQGGIHFSGTHGLVNGEAVVYHDGGGTDIGGLTDGDTYYAVVVDAHTIKLASSFANATAATPTTLALDAAAAAGASHSFSSRERIRFSAAHALTNGEAIVYHNGGGTDVGGLTDGTTYYAVVVNSTSIRLAATHADAVAAAPTTLQVDLSAASGASHDFTSAERLNLGAAHGFTTGQAIVYHNGGGTDIGGLADGTTYYAIVVDANTLRLAASQSDAISGTGIALDTSAATGTTHSLASKYSLNLGYAHGFTTGQEIVYHNGGGTDIGGLTDGSTYYVVAVNANTIQLADSYANATAATPSLITLDAAAATGTAHSFDAVFGAGAVNSAGDSINLGYVHGLNTGDAIVYHNGGGNDISGLTDGQTYYAVVVDPTSVKLANSQADAIAAGQDINLTVHKADLGAGTAPTVSVSGTDVVITLNTTAGSHTTVQQLVDAINGTSLLGASLSGDGTVDAAGVTDGTVLSLSGRRAPTVWDFHGNDLNSSTQLGTYVIHGGGVGHGDLTINGANNEIDLAGLLNYAAGSVTVATQGNIYNTDTDQLIRANDISLTSGAGVVGQSNAFIHTQLGSGVLNADANGSVYVDETAGTMRLGSISSSTGGVWLTSVGSIVDDSDGGSVDITAATAVLNAGTGIGSGTNAIETSLGKLEANAGTGGIWVTNGSNLEIGGIGPQVGVAAGGTVDIRSSASSVTVSEAVDSAHGPVSLMAATDVNVNAVVTSGGGTVGVSADRDITFAATGRIDTETGSSTVTLTADADGVNGGAITMADGSSVSAVGGAIDVNATGNITLSLLTTTGAVTVDSVTGAILDTLDAGGDDIVAATAILNAGAGIGTAGNGMETRLGKLEGDAGTGGVWLTNTGALIIGDISAENGLSAGGPIVVTTMSPLTVHEDVVAGGDITLTATDHVASGDDLTIENNATVQSTGGSVVLNAGDNFLLAEGSTVEADGTVTIHGDYGNADAGVGSTIDLIGVIHATSALVQGNVDNDTVNITNVAAGTPTTVEGGEGNDTFNVAVTAPTSNRIGDVLTVDGQGGDDSFMVNNAGSGDSLVKIIGGAGTDDLTIYGTDNADQFLLRKEFVAMLSTDTGGAGHAERINYNDSTETMEIYAKAGDDRFNLDDNSAVTTLFGGAGDDYFQVGQLFNESRVAPHVAAGDEFDTLATTKGLLSAGNSKDTIINGEDGNDTFLVLHNTAQLDLNGGDGNDSFTVRAFALIGSHAAVQGTTNVSGGSGGDYVEYAINAPVNVDGGDGLDKVVLVGTEFSDTFVITDHGVFGAGLNVSYKNTETVEVDGAEGNDTFYVLSTAAGSVTRIFGGLGSDTFNIAADVPSGVVAVDKNGDPIVFPPVAQDVNTIQGPLIIDGYIDPTADRTIPAAVMLPTETDGTVYNAPANPNLNVNEADQIDRLNVYNQDSTRNDVGTLTSTRLYGLGMGGDQTIAGEDFNGGITYAALEDLNINLGVGNDTLTIESTHQGSTTVNAGPGNDNLYVRTISGVTTLNAGAGNDHIVVTHQAPVIGGGLVGGIGADLYVYGQGGSDRLDVDDSGQTSDTQGTLTSSTLNLEDMPGQITYGTFEDIYINLGSGSDYFNVEGTQTGAHTRLSTADGNDVINVSSVPPSNPASDAFGDPTQDAGLASGNLDAVTGELSVFAGTGLNTLNVSDYGSSVGDGTNGAPVRITSDLIDGLAPAAIHYYAAGGRFAGGVNILAGSGSDTVRIESTRAGDVTSLWANGGDDHITAVDPNVNADGLLVMFGELGNDTLDASGWNTRMIAFGDFGSMNWGATKFSAYKGLQVFQKDAAGNVGLASTHIDMGGNDVIKGGSQDDQLFGGFGDDTIDGNGGDDIILGDNGETVYTDGYLSRISSTDTTDGTAGNDTIHGNDGNDLIIGGPGSDTLYGDDGNDNLIGDNGEFFFLQQGQSVVLHNSGDTWSGDGVPGTLDVVWSTDPNLGGSDTIDGGNGNDNIIGGAAGDKLYGGLGEDIINGDGGQTVYEHGLPILVETIDPFIGGDDVLASSYPGTGDDGALDIMFGGFGNDLFYSARGFAQDVFVGEYARATISYDGPGNSKGVFVVRLGQGALDVFASTLWGLYTPEGLTYSPGNLGFYLPRGGAGTPQTGVFQNLNLLGGTATSHAAEGTSFSSMAPTGAGDTGKCQGDQGQSQGDKDQPKTETGAKPAGKQTQTPCDKSQPAGDQTPQGKSKPQAQECKTVDGKTECHPAAPAKGDGQQGGKPGAAHAKPEHDGKLGSGALGAVVAAFAGWRTDDAGRRDGGKLIDREGFARLAKDEDNRRVLRWRDGALRRDGGQADPAAGVVPSFRLYKNRSNHGAVAEREGNR